MAFCLLWPTRVKPCQIVAQFWAKCQDIHVFEHVEVGSGVFQSNFICLFPSAQKMHACTQLFGRGGGGGCTLSFSRPHVRSP